MNRRSLGVVAVILIALMAIVLVADLDGLPRPVRQRIDVASAQVSNDRKAFDESRQAVLALLAADPALYRTQESEWKRRLDDADRNLRTAEAQVAQLKQLEKADRREDRQKAEAALQEVEQTRGHGVTEAKELRAEAERWAGYKKNLPARLAEVKKSWDAIQAFDVTARTAAARKAIVDWPQKKDDLERRMGALDALKKQAAEAWASGADARAKAEAGDTAAVDYSKLFSSGDAIVETAKELDRGASVVNELAAQLYTGRDAVLEALDDENGYRQKVKVLQAKYADATLKNPQTSVREEWQSVDESRFRQLQKAIGMVVERKPAGLYDNEVDRTVQAPAVAYVAPPGQSNAYGSWQNGVWHWLPQYLLLSQLMRGSTFSTNDWYDYDRYRRRGDVWYGRTGEYGSTWQGRTGGTAGGTGGGRTWSDRVGSWGSGTSSQGGGTISSGSTRTKEGWNTGGSTYGGSRYESRGGFSGSRYQSRPGGGSFGSRGYSRGGGSVGRSFGGGGRR